MRKMEKEKICEKMEKELSKIINQNELTQIGLDSAYKIIDIMKDIKNMEYWDVKCEYYREILESMKGGGYSQEANGEYSGEGIGAISSYSNGYDNGNSYQRGRNQRNGQYMHRPNYSLMPVDNDINKYRQMKRQYSSARDGESKDKMLDALEDFMCGVSSVVKQICRDADCREEREIVKKYAREIAEM